MLRRAVKINTRMIDFKNCMITISVITESTAQSAILDRLHKIPVDNANISKGRLELKLSNAFDI